jgi:hypothetical protein
VIAPAEVYYREASTDALVEAAWRAGELSWKLRPHQLRVYEHYRAWEAAPTTSDADGALELVYVLQIARRWGKTFLVSLIKIEDCLRNPGSRHTYACAFAKDIGDIVGPLIDDICADAPEDVRPTYHRTSESEAGGFYFPNGSVLKLVGVDKNPRGLRGRASDGFAVSEAGFVKNLAKTVRGVIYPQFQQRPQARLILESSAPEDELHDFDEVFIPDARTRCAFQDLTIDDNETLDPQEKERFIRAAGGLDSPDAQREYYNRRSRNASQVVVPEFDPAKHVAQLEVPAYADCYVSLDPGMRDLLAILWGYWDFEGGRLVIQRDWAERNASTTTVAEAIRLGELELWNGEQPVQRWSATKQQLVANPSMRVSDTDLRLIRDLSTEHGIAVRAADKRVGAKTELLSRASVGSLRGAFLRGEIVIHPRCVKLIEHLTAARWNDKRTDYERTERFGHFDLLDALMYMHRAVRRWKNPFPPDGHATSRTTNFHRPPGWDKAPAAKPATGRWDKVLGVQGGKPSPIRKERRSPIKR